jgi:hypothetical protein
MQLILSSIFIQLQKNAERSKITMSNENRSAYLGESRLAEIRVLINRYLQWKDPETAFDSDFYEECQKFPKAPNSPLPRTIKSPRPMPFMFDEKVEEDYFGDNEESWRISSNLLTPTLDEGYYSDTNTRCPTLVQTPTTRPTEDDIFALEIGLTQRIEQMEAGENLLKSMNMWTPSPDEWNYAFLELWLEDHLSEETYRFRKDVERWIIETRPKGVDVWWAPAVDYLTVAFRHAGFDPCFKSGKENGKTCKEPGYFCSQEKNDVRPELEVDG